MFDITITKNATESTLITKEGWYRRRCKYEFKENDAIILANGRIGVKRKTFEGGDRYFCPEEEHGYLRLTGNEVFMNGCKTWFYQCIDEFDNKLCLSILWEAIEVDENNNPIIF